MARVRRAPPSSTSASRRRRPASAGSTLFTLLLQACGDLPAGVSRSIRLADLFGQSDDDAFRPADVAKPIRVLVLHHFAYQLGPVGEQARDDSVDVFDGEHDATDAQRVHRRLHGPKPDRGGRVEFVELDAPVAVRGPQQREGGANILEPDQAVDRRSLDLRLAFELEAEFDEENLGRLEVVDNDENVVHALNRHVLHPMPVPGLCVIGRGLARSDGTRPPKRSTSASQNIWCQPRSLSQVARASPMTNATATASTTKRILAESGSRTNQGANRTRRLDRNRNESKTMAGMYVSSSISIPRAKPHPATPCAWPNTATMIAGSMRGEREARCYVV